MAFACGFFDSTTATLVNGFYQGNKAKDAAFFAHRENAIVGNGIYDGSFVVAPSSGLTVSRTAGRGWIQGYYCYDDSAKTKLLTANATHYYVLRLHLGDGEITEQWLTTYTDPVRDGNTYDLYLAKVVIPNGTVTINSGMITDYRNDVTKCGYAQIQPNINFDTITVTAGDIADTASKMIPIKTGAGTKVLMDDGVYETLDADLVPASATKAIPIKSGDGTKVLMDDGGFDTLNADLVADSATKAIPLKNGTGGQYLKNNGTFDYSMRLLATLTTSGNFVTSSYPSYNGLYAFVLIGGGGGGSGTSVAASQRGGGAGGLTSTGLVLKSGTYAFTIGAGGTAGSGGVGGAGGDTVFGSFTAGGGAGGKIGGGQSAGGTGDVTGAAGSGGTGGVNALNPAYGYGGNSTGNPGQAGLKGALLVYGF